MVMRIAFILSLFFSCFLFSQEAEVNVSLNTNELSIDDELLVTYELKVKGRARGVSLEKGDMSDFDLTYEGNSTSMKYENGKMTSVVQYQMYLKPAKTGVLTTPKLTFILSGKRFESPIKKIKVSKQSKYANRKEDRDFFVEASLSKSDVFKGESFIYSISLFTRVNIYEVDPVKTPNLEGFKIDPIEVNSSSRKITMGGETYLKQEVAAFRLTPLKAAEVEFKPIKVNLLFMVRRGFMQSTTNREVETQYLKANIKPLPMPMPKGFTNAIGEYEIKSNLNQSKVQVNKAINWEIEISGQGNIDILSIPEIEFDEDLEVFEPKVEKRISASREGAKGKITYTYVIIPREPGEYNLPEFSLVYFDTDKEEYKSKVISDQFLEVEGIFGEEDYSQAQKEVKLKADDIRYIKRKEKLNKHGSNEGLSWLVYLIFIIAVIAAYISFSYNLVSKSTSKPTINSVVERLESTEINSTDKVLESIQEVYSILWSLKPSDFTKDNRFLIYEQNNVSSTLYKSLEEVIESIELSRYAGGSIQSDLIKKLVDTIKSIEL